MAWYSDKGADYDVAVSSRLRFARNIADYPFASKLTREAAAEIADKVCAVLGDGNKRIDFKNISESERGAYVEMHLASPEFAERAETSVLLTGEMGGGVTLAAMICEEDHVRLQCIAAGNSLSAVYKAACEADDKLCDGLNIAYDEELGFLTHCPTNLGTGMRASVMLFLPALTMTGQLGRLVPSLGKLGLTLRGMYGEGSEGDGCLYQISNQVTLGLSEEDTIKKLEEVVSQLIARERQARDAIKSDDPDRLCDRVMRAYGTLKYAYLMTSAEFLRLFSDVRLGIALGFISDVTYEKLGELMIRVMPAMMNATAGRVLGESERDRMRAEMVNGALV
ncbi:MAG: protein arginine kinase [Clostridia bacterium]|nr:protein arginine kinase [Clostridia bacterium]